MDRERVAPTSRSLGCVPSTNPFRRRLYFFITSKYVDWCLLTSTILNAVIIALDQNIAHDPEYTEDTQSRLELAFWICESSFILLFTVEILIKIYTVGFVCHREAYLRDPFNCIDFVGTISGFISLMGIFVNLSPLRLIRILNYARNKMALRGRVLLLAMLHAFPIIMDTLVLLLFVLLLFANVGIQLYGHEPIVMNVTQTERQNAHLDAEWMAIYGQALCGEPSDPCWNRGHGIPQIYRGETLNFNNVFNSFLVLFKIISIDNWSPEMHAAQLNFGYAHCAYFIVVLIVGRFLAAGVMIAAMTSAYGPVMHHEDHLSQRKKMEKNWLSLVVPPKPPFWKLICGHQSTQQLANEQLASRQAREQSFAKLAMEGKFEAKMEYYLRGASRYGSYRPSLEDRKRNPTQQSPNVDLGRKGWMDSSPVSKDVQQANVRSIIKTPESGTVEDAIPSKSTKRVTFNHLMDTVEIIQNFTDSGYESDDASERIQIQNVGQPVWFKPADISMTDDTYSYSSDDTEEIEDPGTDFSNSMVWGGVQNLIMRGIGGLRWALGRHSNSGESSPATRTKSIKESKSSKTRQALPNTSAEEKLLQAKLAGQHTDSSRVFGEKNSTPIQGKPFEKQFGMSNSIPIVNNVDCIESMETSGTELASFSTADSSTALQHGPVNSYATATESHHSRGNYKPSDTKAVAVFDDVFGPAPKQDDEVFVFQSPVSSSKIPVSGTGTKSKKKASMVRNGLFPSPKASPTPSEGWLAKRESTQVYRSTSSLEREGSPHSPSSGKRKRDSQEDNLDMEAKSDKQAPGPISSTAVGSKEVLAEVASRTQISKDEASANVLSTAVECQLESPTLASAPAIESDSNTDSNTKYGFKCKSNSTNNLGPHHNGDLLPMSDQKDLDSLCKRKRNLEDEDKGHQLIVEIRKGHPSTHTLRNIDLGLSKYKQQQQGSRWESSDTFQDAESDMMMTALETEMWTAMETALEDSQIAATSDALITANSTFETDSTSDDSDDEVVLAGAHHKGLHQTVGDSIDATTATANQEDTCFGTPDSKDKADSKDKMSLSLSAEMYSCLDTPNSSFPMGDLDLQEVDFTLLDPHHHCPASSNDGLNENGGKAYSAISIKLDMGDSSTSETTQKQHTTGRLKSPESNSSETGTDVQATPCDKSSIAQADSTAAADSTEECKNEDSQQTCMKCWQVFGKFLESSIFWSIMLVVACINAAVLATDHHNKSPWLDTFIYYANLVCYIIFGVEMTLKMIVLGPIGFTSSWWNIGDTVLFLASLPYLITQQLCTFMMFRCVHCLRLHGLQWKVTTRILRSVTRCLASLRDLTLIIILFILVWAFLGNQMFSNAFPRGYRHHFDTLWQGCLTVFILMTGRMLASTTVVAVTQNSMWVSIYFLSIFIFGLLMVAQLTVAALVHAFLEDSSESKSLPRRKQSVFCNAGQSSAKPAWGSVQFTHTIDFKSESAEASQTQAQMEMQRMPTSYSAVKTRYPKNLRSGNDFMGTSESLPLRFAKRRSIWQKMLSWLWLEPPEGRPTAAYLKPKQQCRKYLGPKISRWMTSLVLSKFFEPLVVILVILNTVVLAMDGPNLQDSKTQYIVDASNTFFVIVFIIEMLLKMTVFGLIDHSYAYFASAINWVDCISTILSIPGIWVPWFKLFRSLRLLRIVVRHEPTRLTCRAMFDSAGVMVAGIVLILFFLFLYGIIGVQLFQGLLHVCSDPKIHTSTKCIGVYNTTAEDGQTETIARRWIEPYFGFDNIGTAMMALFQVTVGEEWDTLMFAMMDANGEGYWPSPNANAPHAIYFIPFTIITRFYLIHMFVACLVERLQAESCRYESYLTEAQWGWVHAEKLLLKRPLNPLRETPKAHEPCGGLRRLCYRVVSTPIFNQVTWASMIINLMVVSTVHVGQSTPWELVQRIVNYIVSILLLSEILLKIFAWGPHAYFRDSWNRFDCVVLLISSVAYILDACGVYWLYSHPPPLNALRIFRFANLFRGVHLIPKVGSPALRKVVSAVVAATPGLFSVLLIAAAMHFSAAVLGVWLFGQVKPSEVLHQFANFETLPAALLTLFQMGTTDEWVQMMAACAIEPPYCSYEDGNCGSIYSYVYFPCFILIMYIFVWNFFTAIIVHSFLNVDQMVDVRHVLEYFKHFQMRWVQADCGARGHLPALTVLRILHQLPPPLKISAHPAMIFYQLEEMAVSVDCKGHVLYQDCIRGLVRKVYGVSLKDAQKAASRHSLSSLCSANLFTIVHVHAGCCIATFWKKRRNAKARRGSHVDISSTRTAIDCSPHSDSDPIFGQHLL